MFAVVWKLNKTRVEVCSGATLDLLHHVLQEVILTNDLDQFDCVIDDVPPGSRSNDPLDVCLFYLAI